MALSAMSSMGNNSISLEGLMNRKFIISILILFMSQSGLAKNGVRYLNINYGSVHQNPNASSTSLTVLECGHPVKILKYQSNTWMKVKAGMHSGFVKKQFLQEGRPSCFQDKYPRYFDSLNLTVTEYYFWARLYDNYITSVTTPEGK